MSKIPSPSRSTCGAPAASVKALTPTLSSRLKSKSMPIRSKKSSRSVMNRTSIVTCKSCKRRSCSSRSTISSCTSCVWLMTSVRLFSNSRIEPEPPAASHDGGLTVVVISSLMASKSAWLPPPNPPGPPPPTEIGAVRAPGNVPPAFICASSAGSIVAFPPVPSAVATAITGGAPNMPGVPYAPPSRLCASNSAPDNPIRAVGTKFGIGITRSATG